MQKMRRVCGRPSRNRTRLRPAGRRVVPPALEHPTTTPTAHPCDVITSSCAHSGVFSALGERVAVAQLQAPPPAASRQDSSMTRRRAGQACLSLHGRSYLFCTLAEASLSRQITMKQCVQGPKQRVVTNKEGLHPFAVRWQCSPILRAMCAVQQSFLDATGNTNAADGGGRNASVASLRPPPSSWSCAKGPMERLLLQTYVAQQQRNPRQSE